MVVMFIVALILLLLIVALVWKFLDLKNFCELKKVINDTVAHPNQKQHFISNLFQVDEASQRHGGELLAAVLKGHGVQEIFTLCGGHISPILIASQKLGIKVIDTRHEVNAVFAADACARLRQSFGVVAVTAGPGLTNTITAIKNAQMAESAVLLLGGAAPTLLKNRGALQDIDQMVLFKPICKHAVRITRVCDIIPTIRKAISIAQSDVPGPVFVELPIDILYPYQFVAKEASIANSTKQYKSFKQRMVDTYLRVHICRQFGHAFTREYDLTPLPVPVAMPTGNDVTKCVEMIRNSKRPLLLIGSQALLSPIKVDQLKETVQALSIPVYLGGMARGLLGNKSDIQMRFSRRDALKEADLVILAGTVCDFRLSYGRVLSSKSRIISINRSRQQATKNERLFWSADVLIEADIASTLTQIAAVLRSDPDYKGYASSEWLSSLSERDTQQELSIQTKSLQNTTDSKLNPLRVLYALDKVLKEDSIIVVDGGDFVGSAAYIVRTRGALQWLDPGAFGTLGVGAGFALGAKLVYPNRDVFIIYGDGSCGFSLMEFDTFERHALNIIAIIGNDACWSQIAREQIKIFNDDTGVNLKHVHYEEVNRAFGGLGMLLSSDTDTDKLDKFFENVIEQSNSKRKSAIVNVIIGKTDFRDGSISV